MHYLTLFIPNPDKFVLNQQNKVSVQSRPFKYSPTTKAELEEFNFDFVIKLVHGNNLQILTLRNGNQDWGPRHYYNFDPNKYLYIGITIGHAIINYSSSGWFRPRITILFTFTQGTQSFLMLAIPYHNLARNLQITLPETRRLLVWRSSSASPSLRPVEETRPGASAFSSPPPPHPRL